MTNLACLALPPSLLTVVPSIQALRHAEIGYLATASPCFANFALRRPLLALGKQIEALTGLRVR